MQPQRDSNPVLSSIFQQVADVRLSDHHYYSATGMWHERKEDENAIYFHGAHKLYSLVLLCN